MAPLLVPAARSFGIDPLHFGMIFIVNIMIGGLTPPFGSMMFTVCTLVIVKLEDFVREVWPFILALILVLMMLTYSESIALKYGLNKDDMVILGDRLYTDIKTGENAGITFGLVYSGETKQRDYKTSEIKANYVFNSVKDMIDIFK